MIKRFEAVLLEEAMKFLRKQSLKSKNKILQNIERARETTDSKLFKKLQGEIWEFRTLYAGLQYRLLAFWDKNDKQHTLVLATMERLRKPVGLNKKK